MNTEQLESLPFKESRSRYLVRKHGSLYNLPKFDHSWVRSDSSDYYWIKARRSIEKFLGKSVDLAFSDYCKKVKLYEQQYFFEQFNDIRHTHRDYYIDDNKNIQRVITSRNRSWYVWSLDYKSGVFDLEKGAFTDYCSWEVRNNPRYVTRPISGWIKKFDSPYDPEYRKLRKQIDRQKKYIKLQAKREAIIKADKVLKEFKGCSVAEKIAANLELFIRLKY